MKESVWLHFPNAEKSLSWKYNTQQIIFDGLQDVWKRDQTQPWVFDISSQLKLYSNTSNRIYNKILDRDWFSARLFAA